MRATGTRGELLVAEELIKHRFHVSLPLDETQFDLVATANNLSHRIQVKATSKLVNGRVTFVNRRLWPAMVAGADHFTPEQLAASRSVHTEQGHHELETTPFPDWVPADAMAEAQRLTAREALSALGDWAGQ